MTRRLGAGIAILLAGMLTGSSAFSQGTVTAFVNVSVIPTRLVTERSATT